MDIPLEIVKKGKQSVDKFVELSNKRNKLSNILYKSSGNIRDQSEKFMQTMKGFSKNDFYMGVPYFIERDNEWKLPDIELVSRLTDKLWTYQRNIETSFSDYLSNMYEFIKVNEDIRELIK